MKYFLLSSIVFGLALSVGAQAQELSVKYCEETKAKEEDYNKRHKEEELRIFDESTKDLEEKVSKLRENWFLEFTKMNEIGQKVAKKFRDKFEAFSKESNLLTKKEFDGGLGRQLAKKLFNEEFSSQARDSLELGSKYVSGSFPCYDRTSGDIHSRLCVHAFKGKVYISVSSRGKLRIADKYSMGEAVAPMRADRLEYPLPELMNDPFYADYYQYFDAVDGKIHGSGGSGDVVDKYKEVLARDRDSIVKRWDSRKPDIGNACESLLKRKSKNISAEEQEAEDAKVNGAQRTE